MNIYIENPSYAYEMLFVNAGHRICSMHEADLIVFTGGEDVSPGLYGKHPHPFTFFSERRDLVEEMVFSYAVQHNIPMVGICRGGQFLNVMSGGWMMQHVGGHGKTHLLTDVQTGTEVMVSSTHHQMMQPGTGAEVVAIANNGGFKESVDDEGNVIQVHDPVDYEVLWYPATSALCFQPHPEFVGKEFEEMQEYFFELINRYIVKG